MSFGNPIQAAQPAPTTGGKGGKAGSTQTPQTPQPPQNPQGTFNPFYGTYSGGQQQPQQAAPLPSPMANGWSQPAGDPAARGSLYDSRARLNAGMPQTFGGDTPAAGGGLPSATFGGAQPAVMTQPGNAGGYQWGNLPSFYGGGGKFGNPFATFGNQQNAGQQALTSLLAGLFGNRFG